MNIVLTDKAYLKKNGVQKGEALFEGTGSGAASKASKDGRLQAIGCCFSTQKNTS